MARRILSVATSALIGFGLGLGLLFQFYPRFAWFVASAPGGLLFSPFERPGSSVWMVPLSNAVAYAAIALLFICASKLIRGSRKRASL
jgi:hypothetical protein